MIVIFREHPLFDVVFGLGFIVIAFDISLCIIRVWFLLSQTGFYRWLHSNYNGLDVFFLLVVSGFVQYFVVVIQFRSA